MLKISIIESRKRRRLVLEGTLTVPWVAELMNVWKAANADLQERKLMVDLRNVTFISEEGKEALSELMSEGAKFSSAGVFTKHVIQQLARRSTRGPSELFHAAHTSMERGERTKVNVPCTNRLAAETKTSMRRATTSQDCAESGDNDASRRPVSH